MVTPGGDPAPAPAGVAGTPGATAESPIVLGPGVDGDDVSDADGDLEDPTDDDVDVGDAVALPLSVPRVAWEYPCSRATWLPLACGRALMSPVILAGAAGESCCPRRAAGEFRSRPSCLAGESRCPGYSPTAESRRRLCRLAGGCWSRPARGCE